MKIMKDNMASSKCRKLLGLFFVLLLLIFVFVLSNCHKNQTSAVTKVERCGSDKLKGTYYDFRSNACVVPTQNEFEILFNYAQTARIAAAKNPSIPFYITFSENASLDDIRAFLSAAAPTEYQNIGLLFPTIGHGLRAGWPIPTKTASLAEALQAIQTTLLALYDGAQTDWEKTTQDGLISSFKSGNYHIIEVKIVARPDAILRTWGKYYHVVKGIEPRSSPISWPNESPDFFK